LDEMIRRPLHESIEYIAVNTDVQALEKSLAPQKIQIGAKLLRGLGAGGNPELGRQAALESYEQIKTAIDGADMVIIVAGMGHGGTGTGAAPVVAQIAQELGAFTVPIVTRPFFFEGKKSDYAAQEGVEKLLTLKLSPIVIPNDRLISLFPDKPTVKDVFLKADETLCTAVQGITDPILRKGLICYDFADHMTILSPPGVGAVGIGNASGPARARDAAMQALSSPLLAGISIDFAQGVLLNIAAAEKNIILEEVAEAISVIQDAAHEDAHLFFTCCFDESLKDEMHIIMTVTGIADAEAVTRIPEPLVATDGQKDEFEYPTFRRQRE
jgi:cell division protein FtsZ